MNINAFSAKKWTNEQVMVVIDAIKLEPCLYVVNSANYHNKHLRNEALNRVSDAVRETHRNVITIHNMLYIHFRYINHLFGIIIS
ncbi:hypothetical protein WN55_05455 [Dufourea novaeangliae]|uniref:MADF domain-containing protein n=1 Tax=Dufourea novaeangliae TaxID=178035 RepID=A0A154P0H7_DUFNO|nr:hypothetical protein WN55_05455 [Dufourea novaeangliae]